MDEQRQAEVPAEPAETEAWRGNGTYGAGGAHARSSEQPWSNAGAALEPAAEPLALLTNPDSPTHRPDPLQDPQAAAEPASEPAPRSRHYAPGLDDDTPVSGVSTVEPPLWREAARHSPSLRPGYGAHLTEYPSTPPPAPPPRQPTPPPQPAPLPSPAPPPRAAPPEPPAAPRADQLEPAGLPQRVPAEPDVPDVPVDGPGARERWTAPELAWIADQLRRDDVPQAPAEGLDVDAVLEAVREVPGVRSASVRPNPTGVHTLRLDLADDADPGQVSRLVARLLEERMGLSAAPQPVPPAARPATGRAEAPPPPPAAETEPPPPQAYEPPPPQAYEPPPEPQEYEADETYEVDEAGEADEPDEAPEVVPRPLPAPQPGQRVLIDEVHVSMLGLEATVEVQLTAGDRRARGLASGPAVDSFVIRLAAVSAAMAIDELLRGGEQHHPVPGTEPSRCFVEHTAVVPFGNTEVAVVVLLLVCGGWVEQLTGSARVDGDPRQAMVRATLGAVNRRLEALLG